MDTQSHHTRIGYWRPLIITADTRPVSRGGRLYIVPVFATTLDDIDDVADARRELEEYRATGRHRHIHRTDIAAAGSVEAYLTQYLARRVASAEADLALPVPVADTLAGVAAHQLAAWLDGGEHVMGWRGYSTCRLCGWMQCGDADLTRGGYVYPSGLSHYVREHHVAVPGLDMSVVA